MLCVGAPSRIFFFWDVPFWKVQTSWIFFFPLTTFHGKLGPRAHFGLLYEILAVVKNLQADFGPFLYVQVDAQVEKHHADERGEELEGGGRNEKVPVVKKFCIAFPIGNGASAGYVFPADDCRSVEQES